MEIKTKNEALDIIGGLSSPSKMPGYCWSIPAETCKRGSILRKIKNTTCSNCYACKGRYVFKNVKNALQKRFEKMDNPNWVNAIVFLIKDETYFRWFDSGDIQNIKHLEKIVEICKKVPTCKHWIPTREYKIVKEYLKKHDNYIPKNCNIRISTDQINNIPPKAIIINGCTTSTVSLKNTEIKLENSFNCPITKTNKYKKCDEANCYNCWNKKISNINYFKH